MAINPQASLTITAFDWVPEFAKGYVRDLRPRWACEETGLVRLRPRLGDYVARCLSRPAFDRALGAQLAAFERTERRKNPS